VAGFLATLEKPGAGLMDFPLASALDGGQMVWPDHGKQVDPGQRPVKAISEGGFWRSAGHCSAFNFVCIASHTLQISRVFSR
jgi:hypothetical protein